jgi:transposase
MTQSSTRYVGRDVHQESLAVAYVAEEHQAAVISLGSLGTRQCDIDRRIRTLPSTSHQLVLVSDAGPCGSWRSRDRPKKGHIGWVVAPSLLPKKAGDRVNTTRRDAIPLARLRRSGDRTPVSVPQGEDDAIRDLSRAREEALRDLQTAKQRLNAFLLRHDLRSTGRATGGPAHLRHLRWRSEGVWPTPAQHSVFQASVRAVTEPSERRGRRAQELQDQVHTWRLRPVVDARQALRGVQLTVAVTIGAEWGDLSRFDKPTQLRSSLGLTPSAYSTGAHRRQGAITKTGTAHARRALIEGAWASRSPATVSRHLPWRLAQRPTPLQDISGRAQARLCTRDRPLRARGTPPNRGVVAIARELSAFLGAMAQQVPATS